CRLLRRLILRSAKGASRRMQAAKAVRILASWFEMRFALLTMRIDPITSGVLLRDRRGTRMSVVSSIRSQLAPIHPEGYPFIGAFALASLILFWVWSPLGWIGTVLTLLCT